MGENRSLDDFLTPGGDGSTDEDSSADLPGEGASDEGVSDESTAEASTAEPPTDEPSRELNDATEHSGGETDGETDATDAADADTIEDDDTPLTTYRWSPDGDDCPACGATVERQWRDGDRFVCADCKEW